MPNLPTPAIVVAAYNRPYCLQKLLQGLAAAHYPHAAVPLLISIDDAASNSEVVAVAQAFNWQFGSKTVIEHPRHLGLKAHILACGQLAIQYGSLILLEDDLLVSPQFYPYTQLALQFYEPDVQIAGISLYHYEIAENGFYPFIPIDDGSDVYFMQIAASWGQAWTAQQWQLFTQWLNKNPDFDPHDVALPAYLTQWSAGSWKKHFIQYLIHNNRYFVFPRLSFTTNSGAAGANADTHGLFQVPLQLGQKPYSFVTFENSKAVYDAFFELLPQSLNRHTQQLEKYDYTIDLYGTKTPQQINTPYVLTTRATHKPILSFGQQMLPNIANVIYNIDGHTITFIETKNLQALALPAYRLHYRLSAIAAQTFGTLYQYPVISIVLPLLPNMDAELLHTLQSILNQHYSNLEIVIPAHPESNHAHFVQNNKNVLYNHAANVLVVPANSLQTSAQSLFQVGISHCSGSIINYCAHAGSVYLPHSLHMVARIFSDFKQVNWLLGTHSAEDDISDIATSLPQYRWSSERFYHSSYREAATFLQPQCMFWRRHLSTNIGQIFNPIGQNIPHLKLAAHFFTLEPLFPVFRPIALLHSGSEQLNIGQKETEAAFTQLQQNKIIPQSLTAKIVAAITKPFYRADIPYLRALYIAQKQLPQVLRYHPPTQSYYLSPY